MFPSLSIPSSGQHLIIKDIISVHYRLWDPIILHNLRKKIIKVSATFINIFTQIM